MQEKIDSNTLIKAGEAVMSMLFSGNLLKQYVSSWALVWLGRLWTPPSEPDLLGQLFALWQHNPVEEIKRLACQALTSQSLVVSDAGQHCVSIPNAEIEYLLQNYDNLILTIERAAVLIVSWYLHKLDDMTLKKYAHALVDNVSSSWNAGATLRELLKHLGEKPHPTWKIKR